MSSFQQQESPRTPGQCAAGCGFYGSPDTSDMCSVCHEKQYCPGASFAADASRSAAASAMVGAAASSTAAANKPAAGVSSAEARLPKAPPRRRPPAAARAPKKAPRCAACHKEAGLAGFVCRCGETFCRAHCFVEQHGCSLDSMGAGRL
ncbi:zinc finger A20 and AN1 domain-containing stress-associated protein 3-like [Panicum miliaceum]|uniref:Zinc finger A20 and AN1 domain-containing stress-associated protein 3-like n=1 Tax=Panicum miliaceum TaxID=4540 RepID=A0A3L6SKW2_PANMI|nr:zinc finger A20 and AN1 domain-containing stress-associated protein 3-like [Panicum miliaceum]